MKKQFEKMSNDKLGKLISNRLFNRTFLHPVLGHLTQWVSTLWLQRISNPIVDNKTDLGTWDDNPNLVGMEELYENMLSQGMRDPLIVGVGRITRRVRLETGNHRVNIFVSKGIMYVPAVAYIGDSAITHIDNGLHEGELMKLNLPIVKPQENILGPYPIKEYANLSKVLGDLTEIE